jgi:hypothetical protein
METPINADLLTILIYIFSVIFILLGIVVIVLAAKIEQAIIKLYIVGGIYLLSGIIGLLLVNWWPLLIGLVLGIVVLKLVP